MDKTRINWLCSGQEKDDRSRGVDNQDLQSQRLDHLGIVAGICNEIGLAETIDVTHNQIQVAK